MRDGNCNGMSDEPPVGMALEGFSLQGAALSVEWYGDEQVQYAYVGAGSVLQVYEIEPVTGAQLVHEINLRDLPRDMKVAEHPGGATLFVAVRGDGLWAFDLSDPAQPYATAMVVGRFDVGPYTDVEAIFNGVDARWDGDKYVVAAAHQNYVSKISGGVDAVVFHHYPDCVPDCLIPVTAIEAAEVRGDTPWPGLETPFTVGLTADAQGLYLGYVGNLLLLFPQGTEVVYVDLSEPDTGYHLPVNVGWAWDIETYGSDAFLASGPWTDFECKLARLSVVGSALDWECIANPDANGPGGFVDVDGDLLAFAITAVGRDSDNQNLYLYSLASDDPTLTATACTMDWVFSLACRDAIDQQESDWIYVADEWGGLQLWESPPPNEELIGFCQVDSEPPYYTFTEGMRSATGAALSGGVWLQDDESGTHIVAAKGGSGFWYFDELALDQERPAVEWIDWQDPGCNEDCDIYCGDTLCCCPPPREYDPLAPPGERIHPYPPGIFSAAGASTQGKMAILATDRNAPGDVAIARSYNGYFMMFAPDLAEDRYECLFSKPVNASGSRILSEGEMLFVPHEHREPEAAEPEAAVERSTREVRLYQHCPDEQDWLREDPDLWTMVLEVPPATDWQSVSATLDMAVHGDLVFICTEVWKPDPWPLGTSGWFVYVYRWKDGPLSGCPEQANISVEFLGSFSNQLSAFVGAIAVQLEVDPLRELLFVGAANGAGQFGVLTSYDLARFDPPDMEQFVASRRDISPAQYGIPQDRGIDVQGLSFDAGLLHVADANNGLYVYAPQDDAYIGFYPASHVSASRVIQPELLEAPLGTFPVNMPISVALSPSGKVVAHEHTTGRAALLAFGVYAAADNVDGPWLGTRDFPYQTIQEAVDAAEYGWPVFVAEGTYEERVTLKPGVRLYGGHALGSWVRDIAAHETIIANPWSPGGPSNNYTVIAAEGCRIDGFTIQGFDGIQSHNCSPVIVNNTVRVENVGLYTSDEAHPYVARNRFFYNNSNNGIECWLNAHPTIVNNLIVGNATAGICIGQDAHPSVVNNTIYINGSCGIDSFHQASPSIQNNIIVANGSGVRCRDQASPELSHNDVWANGGGLDYDGCTPGEGDISADPLFGSPGPPNEDYQLTADSPCIDMGSDLGAPADDFEMAPRPVDVPGVGHEQQDTTDIGAYEVQIPAR